MDAYADPSITLQEALDVRLLCLLKVGREEHMNALRDGRLYCRRLSYYTEFEGKPLAHHDAHEAIESILQASQVEIKWQPRGGAPIIINAASGLIGEVLVSRSIDAPVFCLHAIHTGEWTHRSIGEAEIEAFKEELQVPQSMGKFGSHVWAITDATKFLERVRAACQKQNVRIRRGFVRYVNRMRAHGTIPLSKLGFVKLDDFKDEREYRFMFISNDELPDPFVLDVGSLHDISIVTSVEEFRNGWELSSSDDSDE